MPRQILVFDFDEKPREFTVGKSMIDAIVWRGRLYERDWSDDETQDDSKSAEPICLVTEDDRRFKPAIKHDFAAIANIYSAAARS